MSIAELRRAYTTDMAAITRQRCVLQQQLLDASVLPEGPLPSTDVETLLAELKSSYDVESVRCDVALLPGYPARVWRLHEPSSVPSGSPALRKAAHHCATAATYGALK